MPAVMPSRPTPPPTASSAELEATLVAVETQLSGLGAALLARDSRAIDAHAVELPRALARAVMQFSAAAQRGPVPPALRQRLSRASSVVAAQRESFARATAALDRAIDVLLPREATGIYNAAGTAGRGARSGSVQA